MALPSAIAAPLELLPGVAGQRFDFEQGGLDDWQVVAGRWAIQGRPGGTVDQGGFRHRLR